MLFVLVTKSVMQLDIWVAAVRMPTTEAATDRGSMILRTAGMAFVEDTVYILLARL